MLIMRNAHLLRSEVSKTIKSFSRNQSSNGLRDYRYFLPLQTRWSDNDQYGHVNNAVYYQYIDTVVNNYLIWFCGLVTNRDLSKEVGFMVETNCSYKTPVEYPDVLLGGLVVEKVGRSSVQYKVGIFKSRSHYFISNGTTTTQHEFDPFSECGLTMKGMQMTKESTVYQDLEKHFHREPVAIGKPVHVFVDNTNNRPITGMSDQLLNGLKIISNVLTSSSKL